MTLSSQDLQDFQQVSNPKIQEIFRFFYKYTISVKNMCFLLKQLFVDCTHRTQTLPPSARWLHANRQNVGELCTKPGGFGRAGLS